MDKAKLQQPSEAPPLMTAIMHGIVVKLALASHVRSARIDSETARLKPGSSPPPGRADWSRENLWAEYQACDNNWCRLKVLRKGERRLRDLTRGQDLSKRRGTKEWKAAIANDPRASRIVAVEYGVSASYVRKLRARQRMG